VLMRVCSFPLRKNPACVAGEISRLEKGANEPKLTLTNFGLVVTIAY
jgi:hypothetical protein